MNVKLLQKMRVRALYSKDVKCFWVSYESFLSARQRAAIHMVLVYISLLLTVLLLAVETILGVLMRLYSSELGVLLVFES